MSELMNGVVSEDVVVATLDKFPAPFNKEVELQQLTYNNDYSMLRVRIREGKRFTMMDLDTNTAAHWGQMLVDWANAQKQD